MPGSLATDVLLGHGLLQRKGKISDLTLVHPHLVTMGEKGSEFIINSCHDLLQFLQ